MAANMLELMPVEILRMTIEQFTNVKDTQRLCAVSKRLYNSTMPALYQTVYLSTPEQKLADIAFCKASKSHLSFTKHLHICAPFRNKLQQRCPHNEVKNKIDDEIEHRMNELGKFMLPTFEALTDNQLRKFSWNIGICIPQQLLGFDGYLPKRQKCIEELSLVTDSDCVSYFDLGRPLLCLSSFTNIRILSWIGARTLNDFEQLRECLEENCEHLESLALDLLDWYDAECCWLYTLGGDDPWRPPHFLATEVFRIEEGTCESCYPELESLSLSNVSFSRAVRDMTYGLNFAYLRRLELWNCPASLELIWYLTRSHAQSSLKSFEFVIGPRELYEDGYNCDPVEVCDDLHSFLVGFDGLEDLYLLLPYAPFWEMIGLAALWHGNSLRRFVLHSRSRFFYEASEEWLEPQDMAIEWKSDPETSQPLPKNLECVGINTDLPSLMSKLAKLSEKPPWKILHIRASGSSEIRNNRWKDPGEPVFVLEEDDVDDEDKGNHSTDPEDVNLGPKLKWSRRIHRPKFSADQQHVATTLVPEAPLGVLHFAEWIFGLEGLPDLEILAFGDFSHKGRFADHNVLLCRNEFSTPGNIDRNVTFEPSILRFRKLSESDKLFELYKLNVDFLEACAADKIMSR